MKKDEQPFCIFGDQPVYLKDKWLYCYDKNVMVSIPALQQAMRELGKQPIGKKNVVGIKINQAIKEGDLFAELRRDEHRTHIGCLSEPTVEFNKKYIQLIKNLNKKNDDTKQSGSSAEDQEEK